MAYHARLSPSSAQRWTCCTASGSRFLPPGVNPAASSSTPDTRFGTTGHRVFEEVLSAAGTHAVDYVGRTLCFGVDRISGEEDERWFAPDMGAFEIEHSVVVDEDMAAGVDRAAALVRELHALHGGVLLTEQRVPIGHITGETGATGSADVIMLTPPVLRVFDLKMGRHRVDAYTVVSPETIDPITGEITAPVYQLNLQLACYALGALEQFGLLGDFTHAHLMILQPMLHHASEATCAIA